MTKVPTLRFKEFSEDWNLTNLRQVTNGFEYGMNSAATEFDGENKYIRITDIDESTNKYLNNNVVSPSGDLEEKYLVKQNDILFARTGASTGKTYLYNHKDGKLYFAGFLIRANINCDNNSKFIFLQTKTRAYNNWVQIMSMRSGQPGINSQEYASYSFYAPSKEEQEKIASFFSLIDKKIELQTEKVEELKNYKKGIMQKIFSQELRFKDENGNEYPEWEEKKLGEIGYFKTSSVDKNINENEELVYLVNYMDVYRHIDITKDTVIELMKVSAKENQIENNNLIKGDILFTPSSETPEDIGHSIVIFEDLHKTLYSYHLVRFRPAINLDLLYSHYFCNIDSVRSQIVKFATGSTRFTVSINEFSQVKVNLPSYDEQKKIGLFLNNIDTKIKKEQEKLEYLIEYKKGLLQQMFI